MPLLREPEPQKYKILMKICLCPPAIGLGIFEVLHQCVFLLGDSFALVGICVRGSWSLTCRLNPALCLLPFPTMWFWKLFRTNIFPLFPGSLHFVFGFFGGTLLEKKSCHPFMVS